MEGKRVRQINVVILMAVVLIGMFVGQSSASFKNCYKDCLLLCIVQHPSLGCPFTCLKDCIFKVSPSNDLHNYCKLGCASSTCTNISTPQDPREKEVEGCVHTCSNKCIRKY